MAQNRNWPTKRLGDLAEFRNGVNYNKSSFGKGIKVVGVSNFQNYTKPRYAELKQINPEGIVSERNILRDGDIVFVRSNGNRQLIGRSLFIEQPPEEVTHSAFTIRLRFTSRQVNPKFYAYCFRTRLIRHSLSAHGGGTNINNLNQDILGALEVPFPPLSVQNRIAGVLSAYDDLIENNTRRIKILEKMAQSLYREWFVHFRFPGHEEIKLVDSRLGKIPERWKVKKLGDVIELAYGKALKAEERAGGRFPVFGSSGIVGFHDRPLAKGPGIIVGRKGNVGSIFWAESDFYAIDTVFFVRTELSLPYVFYSLRDQNFINNDAAVPGLSRSAAYLKSMIVPDTNTLNAFEEVIITIFDQVRVLGEKNSNLRSTRDLLLPNLICGKVSECGSANTGEIT